MGGGKGGKAIGKGGKGGKGVSKVEVERGRLEKEAKVEFKAGFLQKRFGKR